MELGSGFILEKERRQVALGVTTAVCSCVHEGSEGLGAESVKGDFWEKRLKICMWREVAGGGCMSLQRDSGGAKNRQKTRAMVGRARGVFARWGPIRRCLLMEHMPITVPPCLSG